MMTSAQAYIKAQAKADKLALDITHKLGCIEAFRNKDEDTWSSVATLNSINCKLEEVLGEIQRYYDLRVEEE